MTIDELEKQLREDIEKAKRARLGLYRKELAGFATKAEIAVADREIQTLQYILSLIGEDNA